MKEDILVKNEERTTRSKWSDRKKNERKKIKRKNEKKESAARKRRNT